MNIYFKKLNEIDEVSVPQRLCINNVRHHSFLLVFLLGFHHSKYAKYHIYVHRSSLTDHIWFCQKKTSIKKIYFYTCLMKGSVKHIKMFSFVLVVTVEIISDGPRMGVTESLRSKPLRSWINFRRFLILSWFKASFHLQKKVELFLSGLFGNRKLSFEIDYPQIIDLEIYRINPWTGYQMYRITFGSS